MEDNIEVIDIMGLGKKDSILNDLAIEIVIRGEAEDLSDDIKAALDGYMFYEAEGKLVARVPTDWVGFRNGIILDLMKTFGEQVYITLSFFSASDSKVFDFEAQSVVGYDSVIDNLSGKRYNKKRLVIVEQVNQDRSILHIYAFVLNLKFSEPVVKVLDAYVVGDDAWFVVSNLLRVYKSNSL